MQRKFRLLGRLLLGLLGILVLVVVGGVVWLMNADLKAMAEKAASDALERRVVADSLTITWGNPIHIELHNVRIANADRGSTPEIIKLANFSADVDPVSLWDGMPIYRHLRADGLAVVLERDDQGRGNWKFGSSEPSSGGGGGFALIPKNRTQFPTLLDMVLKDALITYRTYSGKVLRIQLDNVAIVSEGEDTPVSLKAAGAYNNTSLILDAKTQSFDTLRDADTPFGTVFTLAGKTARLDFDGTMMEPLDFEGVEGQMKLDAAKLGNLLASFGAEVEADYPLIVDAHLTRKGDHWELTKAKGELDQGRFTGTLILDEGSKGSADAIATDLSFDILDLNRLIAKAPNGKESDPMQMALVIPADPGVILDAKVKTEQLLHGKMKLADVRVAGSLGSRKAALSELSFAYAGGRVSGAAQIKSTENTSDIAADAKLADLDANRLAQEIGAVGGDLTGKLNGAAHLDMAGNTLGAALKRSNGAAILSMTNGSIKRSIIEKASTDLRSLFRERAGASPIECLGAVVILKNGIATLAPMRLQAKDATLIGSGTVDLVQKRVDLSAKSERASTGFFALDLPVKVSGTFDNLAAGLGGDAEKKWQPIAGPDMAKLSPEIQQLAAANPCLQ